MVCIFYHNEREMCARTRAHTHGGQGGERQRGRDKGRERETEGVTQRERVSEPARTMELWDETEQGYATADHQAGLLRGLDQGLGLSEH